MEIFTLDAGLNLTGIIQNFNSLEWFRKLSEPGTFSASFLYTDADILQTGVFLFNTDETEPGIITRLSKETDQKGNELIQAKGYMASRIFNQRIIATREILTGTPSEIMRTLVTNNVINPSDSDRAIPSIYLGEDNSTVETEIEYQTEYVKLSKALTDIANAYDLGYTLSVDIAEQKLYFDIWSGTDRTVNGEHPCLFSPEFGSVFSQRYYEDNSNFANYIMCGSGNDDDRIVQAVGSGTGLARYEMYATASGISKKDQTEAQIREQLKTAGAEKLAKYPMTKGFESKINAANAMEFHLGDYVTCENKHWGVREDMQVKAIRNNIKSGKNDITVTFGDAIPTLTGLLKAKE